MYGDFNRVFQNEDLYSADLPDELQKVVDKELPVGLTYKKIDGDYYIISADDGKISIKASCELPEKYKEAFENDNSLTQDDLAEYLYNSQKELVVKPQDGLVEINGKMVNMDFFIKNPFSDIKVLDSKMIIVPSKMMEEYDVDISCTKLTKKMHFTRIPNDDVFIKRFVSDSSALKIIIDIDRKHIKRIQMKIDIDVYKALDVDDVISSYFILEAIAKNEINIGDKKMDLSCNNPNMQPPESIIDFWQKAKKVEETTGVKFDLHQGVTRIDAKNIFALYRTLIEHKPYKEYADSLFLNGEKPDSQFLNSLQSEEGFYFEYTEGMAIDVLGQKIQLYALVGIFNARLSEDGIKISNDNYQIKITSMKEKRLYRSFMYFLEYDQDIEIDHKGHRELLDGSDELEEIEYI